MELVLKYGANPHQKQARLYLEGKDFPFKLHNGTPGYINILDLFGAWQLARELKEATGLPGAASFKHVSPAGAAIAKPLSPDFRKAQFIPDGDLSPVAQAYARARGGDRMCSFGDVGAVSEVVDVSLAELLAREVSDAMIAPGYEPKALEILKKKAKGRFLIVEIDPKYEPPAVEDRDVFGVRLEQERNRGKVTRDLLKDVTSKKKAIPEDVAQTLLVATVALKYTQSNSVCIAYEGQVIGMGAGQQSRVHCTRLACGKADKWMLQHHPRIVGLKFREGLKRPEMTNAIDQLLLWDDLSDHEKSVLFGNFTEKPEPLSREERAGWIGKYEGVALSSDAYIPFRDNIDRASRSNVKYVMHAGGSVRDDEVAAACDEYGMVLVRSGMRCFLH